MVSLLVKMTRCFGIPDEMIITEEKTEEKRVEPCPNLSVPKPISRSHMDSLSLGVKDAGGIMHVLIPSNTKIPKKVEIKFISTVDYQFRAGLEVYEGESSFTRDNVLIGKFVLDGIPPAPIGVAKLKLCFDLDANGTLRVSAEDTVSCKLKKEITITSDQRRSAKKLQAKNTLQKYAEDIKKTLSDPRYAGKVNATNEQKIVKVADEAISWLNMNQSAKVYEYKDKQKDLENVWNPIITKLYAHAWLQTKVENNSASPKPEPEPVYSSVAPETAFKLDEVD